MTQRFLNWIKGTIVFAAAAAALWPARPMAQNPVDDVRTDLGSALRIVRPLMRDDPQRAIQFLQKLRLEYPEQSRVYLLLGETFQTVGEKDSAIVAYEQCLRVDPINTQAGSALGIIHIEEGRPDEGTRVFRELLTRTAHGLGTYRTIGAALSRNGYYDIALKMYEEGRAKLGENYIIALDIAYLLNLMGRYEEALDEYLLIIRTEPRQHRLAQTKIMELLREHEAESERLVDRLREDAESDAPYRNYVMAVLAVAYLERGMLENALEMALRADTPGTSDGKVLFELAERAVMTYQAQPGPESRRMFDLGLRALDAYVSGFKGTAQLPRANLLLVSLLTDLAAGKNGLDGAVTMPVATAIAKAHLSLDWLIATFPGSEYAEQALLMKGDLLFDVERKHKEALAAYERGLSVAQFKRQEFAERLGRGYLVLGEYEAAQREFAGMVRSDSEEVRDTGVFYTGMLLCFSHRYEMARDTLTALAEANPASARANDAIDLAWLIEEGLRGEQNNLHRYADALKALAAGDTAKAAVSLTAFQDLAAETPLRSRAIILLGDVYASRRDYGKAVEMYKQFTRDYPGDTRVPEVQKRLAQVYEYGYGEMRMALETYENILVEFPYYLFLDEVRDDVNRIRESLKE